MEIKVAKFLTIVSLTLVILHSPSHVIRLKMLIASFVRSDEPTYLDHILQRVFEVMYYLNFSANLMIYVFAGEAFRKTLRQKLCWKMYSRSTPRRAETLTSDVNETNQALELMVTNSAFEDTSSNEDQKLDIL